MFTPEEATKMICSITSSDVDGYNKYLKEITPKGREESLKRWLFAYSSVHTTWQLNLRLYESLVYDLGVIKDRDRLLGVVKSSGAGLHNNRTKYIHDFHSKFERDWKWFNKGPVESWGGYRSRVDKVIKGLGYAKINFAFELLYPTEAEVLVTDTHIMQLYGFTPPEINKGKARAHQADMEDHWVDECRSRGIPPVLARWVFWDRKQGRGDPRYWSYVLEDGYVHPLTTSDIKVLGTEDIDTNEDPCDHPLHRLHGKVFTWCKNKLTRKD